MPPTTFGVLTRPYVGLPGSMRSGENARWKSTPARSPLPSSRIGCTSSSVVPGYVVDSRTTRVPGVSRAAIARVADSTAPTLGRLSSSSGVGTQMTIASASARTASSAVAWKPLSRISATSASVRSSMWERESMSPSTTARDTSNPTTSSPARTAACTSGIPTYPSPMTTASTAMTAPPG